MDLLKAWLYQRKYYAIINGIFLMFYDQDSGKRKAQFLGHSYTTF
jgi:hypothetical protein